MSGERVGDVFVNNMHTGVIIQSDLLGWFSIAASVGDTLLFTKVDYTDQKIVVANGSDMPVYMQPVIKLDVVTIKGQTTKQELSDVMKQYHSQGTFYNGKPPVLSFLTSPITGLYELFGATPGRARRFAAYSKGEVEQAEVQRRYNVGFVKRVTGASDTSAVNFMKYYTPSFEDLKEWNDYELIRRVKKSYEFYDTATEKEKIRLQNLNTPDLLKPEKPDH